MDLDRSVTYGRAEGVGSNIPSRAENQEIGKGDSRALRWGGEHAEDRRIDVIFGDTADVGEFFQRVLIRDVAGAFIS